MSELSVRDTLQPYLRLTAKEKASFLAALIHNMTVAVRDFYLQDGGEANASFRLWNELLHRLAGNLAAMLEDSLDRYPDDVLVGIISDAAEHGLHREIAWAAERAWTRVEKPKRKKSPDDRKIVVH